MGKSSRAIEAILAALAGGARSLGTSMNERDARKASADAALQRLAMEQAMHRAQLGKLDAETRKLLQPPPSRLPPLTVNPGQGVLGEDGNYSVPVAREQTPSPPDKPTWSDTRGAWVYPDGRVVVPKGLPDRPVRQNERAIPASGIEKLVGMDNLIAQSDEVASLLKGAIADGTDVTGRVAGVFREPNWVMNARGKGGAPGKDIRTAIGNLYSTLAKERGGTALSAPEIALLETFLPNKDEDEGTALIKANRFVREMRRMKANKIKGYQQYGGAGVVDDQAPPMDYRVPNPRED